MVSSLHIAEDVLKEGVLLKSFPPESYTIKNLDQAWALLDTEDGQERLYTIYISQILNLIIWSTDLKAT